MNKEVYRNNFESEIQFLKRTASPFPTDKLLQNFRPKSLLLQWHITNQCNLRCLHCYQNEYSASEDLSEIQLQSILNQYIQLLTRWGINGHINITGGEPLANKHLFPLLENIHLHKHLCGFAILSNGTFMTHDIAKHLKKLGCAFFQISIEGNRETHDKIRGEGNLEKCIKALEILKKHNIQTMVSFTSSKLNVDSFNEVVKFCKRNRVDVLWTDRHIPMGNGLGLSKELLQPQEVDVFFAKIYQWHRKLKRSWFKKTELRMHRALNFLASEKHGCNCYRPYKCSAGRTLLTIMPNGDLVPCRRMPIIIGNLAKENIEDLYENSTLLRMLRKNNHAYPGCEKCTHWEVCNGGLRCLSYAYYGNPFMADPQCFKIHDRIPDIKQ